MNETYRHEDRLKETVTKLSDSKSLYDLCHMRWNGEPLPSQPAIKEIIGLCRAILFPGFFGSDDVNSYNLEYITGIRCERLYSLLCNQISAGLALKECNCNNMDYESIGERASDMAISFIERLPEIRRVLQTDVCAIYRGDPAAESREEVIYCYPAIKAISNYRIAHTLLVLGVPVIPRMISEMAHSETGIDIHPGATIGEYFAIDHGTGVVIGETCIIGNNVKLDVDDDAGFVDRKNGKIIHCDDAAGSRKGEIRKSSASFGGTCGICFFLREYKIRQGRTLLGTFQ